MSRPENTIRSGAGGDAGAGAHMNSKPSLKKFPPQPWSEITAFLKASETISLSTVSRSIRSNMQAIQATRKRQALATSFPDLAKLEKKDRALFQQIQKADHPNTCLTLAYSKYYAPKPKEDPLTKRRRQLAWHIRMGEHERFFALKPSLEEIVSQDPMLGTWLMGLITKLQKTWLDTLYQKLVISEFRAENSSLMLDHRKRSVNNTTLLHWMSRCNQLEKLHALLSTLAPGERDELLEAKMPNGITPLFIAVFNGHSDIVRQLIAAGANVNAAMPNGATPLMHAAQNGHTDILRQLIAAGADVSTAKTNGVTSLFIAAKNGHIDIVRQLIDAGADVEATTIFGETAHGIATKSSHTEIADLLLEASRANAPSPAGP